MIKDKKALLLAEETLKIILALIAITFLIFLLYSIYNAGNESQDIIMARGSIDLLETQLSIGAETVALTGPKSTATNKWFLHVWPHEYKKWIWDVPPRRELLEDSPVSCNNMDWESCICICNGNKVPEECDKEGVCIENIYNFELNELGFIEIKPVPLILDLETSEE